MASLKQSKLIALYKDYFEFKEMHYPEDARDALDFVVTEVGEIFDALKRSEPNWVRHNDREADLGMEISQAIMMLLIAADCENIDIEKATHKWMQEKGYRAEFMLGGEYDLWGYPTRQSTKIHVWGKFDNIVQSACGLEMPAGVGLEKKHGADYPNGEPICDTCSSIWHVNHAPKPRRKFLGVAFSKLRQVS